ncbi:magnesium-translocating P-type ATPase [Candidatus Peregrinibacteria bacterium]|nr:magnesium-translocating P-type ATPase [Candidatus Peregrinibacteria bacterium]
MSHKGKNKHPWALNPSELFSRFQTNESGLSSSEAERRLRRHGRNATPCGKNKSVLRIFVEQFTNPLIFVLIFASIIALLLREKTDTYIIVSIVIINGILGFVQEYKAQKTVISLSKFVSRTSKVLRDGTKMEINAELIVPGDIVFLNIGDIVPADIRLLSEEEMSIDESSLTGESMPVVKTTHLTPPSRTLPQYLKNMAFMGTHVMSGSGTGLVIATGANTFFGKSASYLREEESPSDFERGIGRLSSFLLKIVALMTVFIFLSNSFLHHGILESFLFALALAVGITPEILPIIITITLSNGVQVLAKQNVIVKKLSSIEELGNTDILCTDKTGTLTEGKITLQGFYTPDGNENPQLLLYGLLCNDAIISPLPAKKIEGNSIDRALWENPYSTELSAQYKEYTILDRNEFDFTRRRMSVVAKHSDGSRFLIVKGGFESIATICTDVRLTSHNKDTVLDRDLVNNENTLHEMDQCVEVVDRYRKEGCNTIGIAIKSWDKDTSGKEDETGMTLIGFFTFLDPPRQSAKDSLTRMKQLGVEIKVLSGDDPFVTESICKKVGLEVQNGHIYTGDELEKLDENAFSSLIRTANVFSRITPEQKYNIVRLLNTGENTTVAFLGDGINDAPALKVADVGISVNTATDIAKEAADVILLHGSLRVIADGIVEGRKIFGNINKYILNTVSANYGNMFTVAFSSLFLKFIPLLPSQILLNNLLTDAPMLAIASDIVDADALQKPKKLDIREIRSFMTIFGFLSSFFDITLIVSLLFLFHSDAVTFRSAWFLESALSEIVVLFSLRTRKVFFRSKPSFLLVTASIVTVLMLIILMYTSLGNVFEFSPLSLHILGFITVLVALYFISAETLKKLFFGKIANKEKISVITI